MNRCVRSIFSYLVFLLLPLISFSQRSVKESLRFFCPNDYTRFEEETFFDAQNRPIVTNGYWMLPSGNGSTYRSDYVYENSTIRATSFYLDADNVTWIKSREKISYLDAADRIIKIEYYGTFEEEWILKGTVQIQYTPDNCIIEFISDFTNSHLEIQILYPNGCREVWRDDSEYVINNLLGNTNHVERVTTDSGYLEIQHRPGVVSSITHEKHLSPSGKIQTEKVILDSFNLVFSRIDYEYDEQDGLINETHSKRNDLDSPLKPVIRFLHDLKYVGTWVNRSKGIGKNVMITNGIQLVARLLETMLCIVMDPSISNSPSALKCMALNIARNTLER